MRAAYWGTMYDTCANLCTPANLDTPGGFKRKNLPKTDPECEPLYNLPTPSPVRLNGSWLRCAAQERCWKELLRMALVAPIVPLRLARPTARGCARSRCSSGHRFLAQFSGGAAYLKATIRLMSPKLRTGSKIAAAACLLCGRRHKRGFTSARRARTTCSKGSAERELRAVQES